jgi:molybdopterin/thiamine biosynthesis adenylyltransferase
VGPGGQKRLLDARVLVVGAGGLGSPVALYLAAAGIGTLGLVDDDTVDLTNLHRQVLFNTSDIGQSKVQLAGARLEALNPDVEVVTYPERFTSGNADRIASEYELIIDGTDNFATRYLVNDICLKLGIPNVHGSIHRFEGQVSVFCKDGGPCYRCLFPEPPPPGTVPSCAEAGVLGVLPGVIGTLQATEAVKLLLGIGDPLVGRLLRFDALEMRFDEFQVSRSEACAWCAPGAPFPGLVDYDDFCGSG